MKRHNLLLITAAMAVTACGGCALLPGDLGTSVSVSAGTNAGPADVWGSWNYPPYYYPNYYPWGGGPWGGGSVVANVAPSRIPVVVPSVRPQFRPNPLPGSNPRPGSNPMMRPGGSVRPTVSPDF